MQQKVMQANMLQGYSIYEITNQGTIPQTLINDYRRETMKNSPSYSTPDYIGRFTYHLQKSVQTLEEITGKYYLEKQIKYSYNIDGCNIKNYYQLTYNNTIKNIISFSYKATDYNITSVLSTIPLTFIYDTKTIPTFDIEYSLDYGSLVSFKELFETAPTEISHLQPNVFIEAEINPIPMQIKEKQYIIEFAESSYNGDRCQMDKVKSHMSKTFEAISPFVI